MTYFRAIKANILTVPRESWAWEFFARKDDDRSVAVCKECNKHIKCPGGTTSGLHQALKTIIPTSVEAERTFSAAGLFLTKIRSRMANKNLNALATLRTHFNQK